jgi:hypothetical protein
VEALDLALVREPCVAEDQSGDEHGEEARPVRQGAGAVQRAGEREREHRVEALAGEREPAQEREQEQSAGDADGGPDRHLDHELPDDHEAGCVVVRRELDHPDHERDPRRVVHAGLALERRPGTARDLPPAEHGEHHRRVGRGERGAHEAGEHPAEPEHDVREEGDNAGGREGAQHAE